MPRTTGSNNLPRSVRQLRITTYQGDELVFGLENKLADQLAEEIAELYRGADIAEVEMMRGDKLERFRAKDDEKRKEREDERGRRIQQINEREVRFKEEVRPRIAKATAANYNAWLTGYMQKGGEPTHRYDRPLRNFYVAVADLDLMPLYGSGSVSIIVPAGVTVNLENGRDAGHCNLYFMEDFSSLGFHGGKATVPVYSDTRAY